MSFRRRGIGASVDTTEAAELDVLLYEIPEDTVDEIGRSLSNLPVSKDDTAFGPLLRREVTGVNAYFLPLLDRNDDLVLLVVAIRPVDQSNKISAAEITSLIASLRGATGI